MQFYTLVNSGARDSYLVIPWVERKGQVSGEIGEEGEGDTDFIMLSGITDAHAPYEREKTVMRVSTHFRVDQRMRVCALASVRDFTADGLSNTRVSRCEHSAGVHVSERSSRALVVADAELSEKVS